MTIKEVAEKLPINWQLINNPVNWVIVLLMIAIGSAAIVFIFPSTSATKES